MPKNVILFAFNNDFVQTQFCRGNISVDTRLIWEIIPDKNAFKGITPLLGVNC